MTELGRIARSLAAIAFLALPGCTTYKLWTVHDVTPEMGLVELSYEYRKFESPQADERGGLEMARERCRDWGFDSAQRKGEDRECLDGVESSCGKWRVIREYRCLKK